MSAYGIDLGTTYSCLAKFENGSATVIQNVSETSNSLPSAVYFESENSIVVGSEAKNMLQTDATNVVQFVKREIGKDVPPHTFFGKDFGAIEISAMILKKIKAYAEEQGEVINDVVITCPAYFGYGERDATRKAGELAGLNVINLINEPTAAAISYAFRNNNNGEFTPETVVIYDLGGGTFDVTVLKITSEDKDGVKIPHFEVIATDGDDQLGGKDWDQVMNELLTNKVLEETGNSIDDLDEDDKAAIASKVEMTKKSLSAKEAATVRIPIQGETVKFELTRAEFEAATAHLVNKTIDCMNRILARDDVKAEPISKLLLVGGSSNMPMIPNKVKETYPDFNVQLEEPELAVAKGAACYAELMLNGMPGEEKEEKKIIDEEGKEQEVAGFNDYVDDLTPRSFGLGVNSREHGWTLNNLVFKDTVIGEKTKVHKRYSVPYDGCEIINVRVYQNISMEPFLTPCSDVKGEPMESDPADQVSELGMFVLNIPEESRQKGHPMDVDFAVDAGGIHVKVTDGVTGLVFPECDIVYNNSDFNKEESQEKIDCFEISD